MPDKILKQLYLGDQLYWASKYIKQKLTELKGEINSNTIKAVDFTILLSTMDMSSRQGICKEIADMDNTVD